jgi:hypothetical protein
MAGRDIQRGVRYSNFAETGHFDFAATKLRLQKDKAELKAL